MLVKNNNTKQDTITKPKRKKRKYVHKRYNTAFGRFYKKLNKLQRVLFIKEATILGVNQSTIHQCRQGKANLDFATLAKLTILSGIEAQEFYIDFKVDDYTIPDGKTILDFKIATNICSISGVEFQDIFNSYIYNISPKMIEMLDDCLATHKKILNAN